MFVFRKIWQAMFSCNTGFEIRPFIANELKQQITTKLSFWTT